MPATDSPDTKNKLDPTAAQAVPVARAVASDKALRAVDGIRELSKGVTLGVLRIKDLIDEGRP